MSTPIRHGAVQTRGSMLPNPREVWEWQNWDFAAVGVWKAAVRGRLLVSVVWVGAGAEGGVGGGIMGVERSRSAAGWRREERMG